MSKIEIEIHTFFYRLLSSPKLIQLISARKRKNIPLIESPRFPNLQLPKTGRAPAMIKINTKKKSTTNFRFRRNKKRRTLRISWKTKGKRGGEGRKGVEHVRAQIKFLPRVSRQSHSLPPPSFTIRLKRWTNTGEKIYPLRENISPIIVTHLACYACFSHGRHDTFQFQYTS